MAEAKAEVLHSADTFEWFAEEGKRAYGAGHPQHRAGKRHVTLKHPVGVVGAIGPVEFPDHAASAQDRAGPGGRLHHRLQAGEPNAALPDPGIRVPDRRRAAGRRRQPRHWPGQEIGDEFLENPICRKISFTGSTEVGKHLMRGCADQVKRLSLELGGHAPFIVFPDADPEVGAKIGRHRQVPQQRAGLHRAERFYVHKDVQKKFTEAAVEFAKALKLGNGLDAGIEDRADVREEGDGNDPGSRRRRRKCGARF